MGNKGHEGLWVRRDGGADREGMLMRTLEDSRPWERSPDRRHYLLAFLSLPEMEEIWEPSESTRDQFKGFFFLLGFFFFLF